MITDKQKIESFDLLHGCVAAIANAEELDPRRMAQITLRVLRENLAIDAEREHKHTNHD